VSEEEEGFRLVAVIKEASYPREDLIAALYWTITEVVNVEAAVHSAASYDRPQRGKTDGSERVIAANGEVLSEQWKGASDLLSIRDDLRLPGQS
jgi:hypothetical protein